MIKKKLWISLVAFLSGLILLSILAPKAVSNSQGSNPLYLPILLQSPAETWIHVISSDELDRGKTVLAAPNGESYLLVEQGFSPEASYIVIKLTSAGTIQWQKTFTHDTSGAVLDGSLTADGGLILSGMDELGGGAGAQVIKLNSDGTIAWQKKYGGPWLDYAGTIQQTADGGYIFTGLTAPNATAVSDLWLVKLDQNGIIQWQKSYAVDDGYHVGKAIQQTADGGYVVVGFGGNGIPQYDIWVLKLDSSGTVIWQKTFGGSEQEYGMGVAQAPNGDYLVAGFTSSAGSGDNDAWVVRLDAAGSVVWQKSYGGSGDDQAHAIYPTSDGRFAIAGFTTSFGNGHHDAWVMLLDGSGNIIWQNTYGGDSVDIANSVQQLPDGKFLVAGSTSSYDYGSNPNNAWIMKLDANGEIENCGLIAPTTAAVTNTTFTGQSNNMVTTTTQNTATNTPHSPTNSALQMTVICSQ